MASAYKILGQDQGNSVTIIPTVAAGKSYVVSSLSISSAGTWDDAYPKQLRVNAIKSGGAGGTSSAIFYNVPLEKGTELVLTLGITLGEGDRLTASLSDNFYTDGITATAFGEEITV